jgi:D-alanine-D-alanine ligase
VLYGGRSGEHEVSLASAAAVFANLDRQRYEPVAIRIEKDGRWLLADRPPSAASAAEVIDQARNDTARRGGREVILPPRPGEETLIVIDRRSERADDAEAAATVTGLALDVVFPVLHGPYGEDGTVQGVLEMAGVAYVGCGVLASAVAMDKAIAKVLFRARGLLVPDWLELRHDAWRADRDAATARVDAALSYPLFVKPANMGSSVGISKVADRAALATALDLAFTFDHKAVVEAAVPNAREIECAVLGNAAPDVSVPGEIVPSREFYDYEAKYIDAGSRLEIPAPLDEQTTAQVREMARLAFETIDGAGLARVDFLIDPATDRIYLNEINTLPGFTTISMFSKMWAASGLDYPALVDRLIDLALERHDAKQQLKTAVF